MRLTSLKRIICFAKTLTKFTEESLVAIITLALVVNNTLYESYMFQSSGMGMGCTRLCQTEIEGKLFSSGHISAVIANIFKFNKYKNKDAFLDMMKIHHQKQNIVENEDQDNV